jgi:hypothetical protein
MRIFRANEAVLLFCKDKRQLEIANIESELAKPSLNSHLPAFIRRFIECSVTATPHLQGTYYLKPNNDLFASKGLLLSRGILSVCVNENYQTALVANITSNEVVVETTDVIGTLRLVDSNSINSLEGFCIETQSED